MFFGPPLDFMVGTIRRTAIGKLSKHRERAYRAGASTTLQDAAGHILKLPEDQQNLPHWQTAVEMLIRAAEGSPGWMMFARVAMLKAMNYGRERVFSDRKETHWGKRKLKRNQ